MSDQTDTDDDRVLDDLLAERHADRVAAIALVDALPRCMWDCRKPAIGEDTCDGRQRVCDEHKCKRLTGGRPHVEEYHYAEALRALQSRIGVWLGEATNGVVKPPRKVIDLSTDEGWDRAAAGDPIYVTNDRDDDR